MNINIRWTNITPCDFVKHYAAKGVKLSRSIIKQLLKKKGFSKRKMSKKGTIKDVANRDAQFKYINNIKAEFKSKNIPVLSIDTKKKNLLENFTEMENAIVKNQKLFLIMISQVWRKVLSYLMAFLTLPKTKGILVLDKIKIPPNF